MRFLFVYESPGFIGGIETLLARMSNWLLRNGHQVTILTKSADEWSYLLEDGVNCVSIGLRFRDLYYYYHTSRILTMFSIPESDVIKSFDLRSSWLASQIAALQKDKCKVIAGIYVPDFCHNKNRYLFLKEYIYLKNFIYCIPNNARLFCEIEEIQSLQRVHGQHGELWPIPIDSAQFLPASRSPRWGKIVSVGRLDPMKEYNFYMIDVVKELLKRGYKITWSVFGGGKYEVSLRERIRYEGLHSVIRLEGKIPYNRFWQVLNDAYIFVGMGTAILEASLFRVPNVVAIANDRSGVTYGPIYRLPIGSFGQIGNVPPRLLVVDEIERLLLLSCEEYKTEADLVYKAVQGLDIDNAMNRFLGFTRQASAPIPCLPLYLLNYPYFFIRRSLNLMTKYWYSD